MKHPGFIDQLISDSDVLLLQERARCARGDILTMTTLAGCGHPGGSMSSIDMYITLFSCARVFPNNPRQPERDRIVISHGHTSPGAYAALGQTGFINAREAVTWFRYPGSIYEGHVERCVPGIEWGTGNLGQGLSAGCGFALGARLNKNNYRTFVVMGDGEQQKGQISEARRFAVKYRLHTLTALIDLNHLQISGATSDIMPQNIPENFRSDGWKVIEIDGHDIRQIYGALHTAVHDTSAPTAIIARTVMGKGISFMENREKYHGVALTEAQLAQALDEIGLPNELSHYRERRTGRPEGASAHSADLLRPLPIRLDPGSPIQYAPDIQTDNRSAFGNALMDIVENNLKKPGHTPIAVLDCDLASSVKTSGVHKIMPDAFFQAGIQEHNAAVITGALSIEGVMAVFADFGVFGVCETYNQHRLSDINSSNIKLVCTHIGLDVGEDGKTHQCIDYIGLLQNLFGFKIVVPGDPNQTDKATRHMCTQPGNWFLGMGRSRLPVICDESGQPFYGRKEYVFSYGGIDTIRQGSDATILTYGSMLCRAVQASNILKQRGISAGVMNVSCPKDIDTDALRVAAQTGLIVSYEDHNVHTGLGAIIADTLIRLRLYVPLVKLGVSAYGISGTPDEAYRVAGLGVDDLVLCIERSLAGKA